LELKITDFGLATKIENYGEKKKEFCGTPNYMAPEIINGKGRKGHSYEVDIWSIGIIMYTLLVGKTPFEAPGNDTEQTYKNILRGEYEFPEPKIINGKEVTGISDDAKDLIQKILVQDPR